VKGTNMPRARQTEPSTVQARRKTEQARQQEARAVRAQIVDETIAAQKATAKFLASKPTDSRDLKR
jgi:hypothetical protein